MTFAIAPCGMNCAICMAYLRTTNKCPGCRGSDVGKAKTCAGCIIKNCEKRGDGFCFACPDYPCKRLKNLDKRYRTKYHMSMIENLVNIKAWGLDNFVLAEKERWKCPVCNGTICVHKGCCMACGYRPHTWDL